MNTISIVQRFYEHLANGRRQDAYSLLAEDFVLRQAPSLPYGGEFARIDGLNQFFEKFTAFWKSFRTVSSDFYAQDDTVLAVSVVEGTTQNTGSFIRTEMIQIYRIYQEKIVSAQPFYFDTAVPC